MLCCTLVALRVFASQTFFISDEAKSALAVEKFADLEKVANSKPKSFSQTHKRHIQNSFFMPVHLVLICIYRYLFSCSASRTTLEIEK